MLTIKTLFSKYYSLKPPLNPNLFLKNPNHINPTKFLNSWLNLFTTQIPISNSNSQNTTKNENSKSKNKRPLDVLFKEALGFIERNDVLEIESEENGEKDVDLMKKLWDLEIELRQVKGMKGKDSGSISKPKSLVALFDDSGEREKLIEEKEKVVLILKEISNDMEMLLRHLYEKGYFKDANFMPENVFDVCYFDGAFARDFLKFVVERFGEDHQEITKWLSGSDLKTLAQFGCPSLRKREVFAAKRLRMILEISEDTVCGKCCLKGSCKFVNQSLWGGENKNLRLDLLMRLLRTYSLEDIPPQLKLTQDLKACVSRLMHEIINLSKSS